MTTSTELRARHIGSGVEIPCYDDGFGQLYVSRDSMGILGIVRARSWEDAYGICEDEFFPEASETMEEIVKEYGFKVEHVKIVLDSMGERRAAYPDDYPNGRLSESLKFVRYDRVETPDADAWVENDCFQEGFGFRPNGPNSRDTLNHGIYAKDLNGDALDLLTPALMAHLGIVVEMPKDEDEEQ